MPGVREAMVDGTLGVDGILAISTPLSDTAARVSADARRAADANVRTSYASLLPSVSASLSGRYQQSGQQFVQGIALQNNSDIMQGSYGIGVNYTLNSDVLFAPRVASELLSSRRKSLTKLERTSGKHVDVRVSETVPVDRADHPADPVAGHQNLDLDGGVLAGGAEERLERDRVEGHEGVDELAHLARGTEQADVGPAVGDHRQVLHVRPAQCPHQGHRLAPRAPAADPDGHPVLDAADGVVDRHHLVLHAVLEHQRAPALSVPANSSRCSSETPARLSSIVKPCSKR